MTKEQVRIGTSIIKGKSLVRYSHRAKRVAKLGYASLQAQVQQLCERINEMNKLTPPAVNGQPSLAGIAEKDLIADIDNCIGELTRLKSTITKWHQEQVSLLKQRLSNKDGVVDNRLKQNF
jgi:hypothetical protein